MTDGNADPLGAVLAAEAPLEGAALKSCCAAVYGHPAVRWLLGEELHPGGAATTRPALPTSGYERLFAEAGFDAVRMESRREDAARLAERVEERLRGARLLGFGSLAELPLSVEEALAAIGAALAAISDGVLGYAIFSAVRQ